MRSGRDTVCCFQSPWCVFGELDVSMWCMTNGQVFITWLLSQSWCISTYCMVLVPTVAYRCLSFNGLYKHPFSCSLNGITLHQFITWCLCAQIPLIHPIRTWVANRKGRLPVVRWEGDRILYSGWVRSVGQWSEQFGGQLSQLSQLPVEPVQLAFFPTGSLNWLGPTGLVIASTGSVGLSWTGSWLNNNEARS